MSDSLGKNRRRILDFLVKAVLLNRAVWPA
jgi:hypothetical protein